MEAGAADLALDDELAGWFAAIGGRVVTIGPGGDVDDLDRTYADWFARHEVVGALQRPDFVLHGTATDGRSAVELVDSLRAAMRAGGTEAVSWPTGRRSRCP